jgi:hypothetical protein
LNPKVYNRVTMSDHYNPGSVNPASQSFPAVSPRNTMSGPGTGAVTCSSGDAQVPGLTATVAERVGGAGLTTTSSGEYQFRSEKRDVDAVTSHRGLARNVSAGAASQVRAPAEVVADQLPDLAKQVDACAGRPGGLPANVMIR